MIWLLLAVAVLLVVFQPSLLANAALAIVGMYVAARLIGRALSAPDRRLMHRLDAGLCPHCGYDKRIDPDGRCPECGRL